MPNRREHDHIGQIFRDVGLPGDRVLLMIQTLDKVESKLTDQQFDAVVAKLAKDGKFRALFLEKPLISLKEANILKL